jgi:hypothetical protein
MSDKFGSTPWWEFDPDERPVPLGPEATWGASDEAELIVNSERRTIMRENTEPNLVTLAQLAAAAEPRRGQKEIEVSHSMALFALAALLLASVVMFVLGWNRGEQVAARPAVSSSVSYPTSHERLSYSLEGSYETDRAVVKGGEG